VVQPGEVAVGDADPVQQDIRPARTVAGGRHGRVEPAR